MHDGGIQLNGLGNLRLLKVVHHQQITTLWSVEFLQIGHNLLSLLRPQTHVQQLVDLLC